MRIHAATADRVFTDPHGQPSPVSGGLQLVFCDRSTPKTDQWNAYDELRSELIGVGMPAERIRFVHEASDDRRKAALFAACRDGKVSVLIGSTEKMGTGTNIQNRAVALHHADCPWRPADLEQREGRIIRQGNQNPSVEILAYATEGSFDVYMWQLVERKQRFIAQVRAGGGDARAADDLGDEAALSYSEIKALATGNPLIMERAGVEQEVARLERLRSAHHSTQAGLVREVKSLRKERYGCEVAIVALKDAILQRVETRGDRFSAVIDGQPSRDRKASGVDLQVVLANAHEDLRRGGTVDRRVGQLGGFELHVHADRHWDVVQLHVVGLPTRPLEFSRSEVANSDPVGVVRKLENQLGSLETEIERRADRIGRIDMKLSDAAGVIGQPFAHDEGLHVAQRRLAAIDTELHPDPDGEHVSSQGTLNTVPPSLHRASVWSAPPPGPHPCVRPAPSL